MIEAGILCIPHELIVAKTDMCVRGRYLSSCVAFNSIMTSSFDPDALPVPCEGLLFASQQLKRAGLEDITIFEKQEKWGGKTRTHYYKAPGFPDQAEVPVEMGTCYLSNT